MKVHFDTSDVESLRADLSRAPLRIQRAAPVALRNGARSVARFLRHDATGHRHLRKLPGTVSAGRVGPLHWEIGFEKGGQGSLAHIIVYGSVNNAPVFSNADSLRKALPGIERDFAEAGEDSVFGGARR